MPLVFFRSRVVLHLDKNNKIWQTYSHSECVLIRNIDQTLYQKRVLIFFFLLKFLKGNLNVFWFLNLSFKQLRKRRNYSLLLVESRRLCVSFPFLLVRNKVFNWNKKTIRKKWLQINCKVTLCLKYVKLRDFFASCIF